MCCLAGKPGDSVTDENGEFTDIVVDLPPKNRTDIK
jgi:hypothetical protein